MFDPSPSPRVFALPLGVDFAAEVARGLRHRLADTPPHAIARVQVIVNTARMQSRLTQALMAQGPGFLPRIALISDLAGSGDAGHALRTRLQLAQAMRQFLAAQPDAGPTTAAFALADSLYAVLDEMQGEGVSLEQIEALDVSPHSQHWERALRLLRLIARYLGQPDGGQARLRAAVMALEQRWQQNPPEHPVILAGSTGSRGPSALLAQAVARLPLGAVILPGLDTDLPDAVWQRLSDPLTSEDHPQYRHARLFQALDLSPATVPLWTDASPAAPRRNALVSLALRPAPVTDQWRHDGVALGDLHQACADLSLIEAPDPRTEALAIALALRDAAARGERAALITPDRILARRVTAALDRWGIRPDDSAGRPLALTPPARLIRQIAQILAQGLGPDSLIALLKHPLVHSGEGRGGHLLRVRTLEMELRRDTLPLPDDRLLDKVTARHEASEGWTAWLRAHLSALRARPEGDLPVHLGNLITLADALAASAGEEGSSGRLWDEDAGQATRRALDALAAEAEHGGALSCAEFAALLDNLFSGEELREDAETDPRIAIWGTLEARAQSADLVILAGLNEGTWPATLTPDPWFNRTMRLQAGLLLPERQIGLSAHDFQQAIAAPRVILSRARRDAEAETVPARWLNRLTNLVQGLPAQGGDAALGDMRRRGDGWLSLAQALEDDHSALPPGIGRRNPRPAPAPPAGNRLKGLSVTEIETLIRDPYQIYARRILGLEHLDPLIADGDARLRGILFHKIVERYVDAHPPGTPADPQDFMAIARDELEANCPWPSLRLLWLGQAQALASPFSDWNAGLSSRPIVHEKLGRILLTGGFELRGRPDRIDADPDGFLTVYDYKTGAPPGKAEQKLFAKQLPLLAIMTEDGAFAAAAGQAVAAGAYVRIGRAFAVSETPFDPAGLRQHRAELTQLVDAYARPDQGFAALRAPRSDRREGLNPYHVLARLGEWDITDPAQRLIVGDHDG